MNETEFLELLKKYQNGTLSHEDKDRLDAWYLHKASNSKRQLSEYELADSYEH